MEWLGETLTAQTVEAGFTSSGVHDVTAWVVLALPKWLQAQVALKEVTFHKTCAHHVVQCNHVLCTRTTLAIPTTDH